MSTYSAYSQKLKDPRWQRKRLRILERDDFACENCNATHLMLHVHHSYYEKGKEPWEYDDRNLHSFCENCHTSIEQLKESIFKRVGEIFQTHEDLKYLEWHLDDLARLPKDRRGWLHCYIKDFMLDDSWNKTLPIPDARHMDQAE